MKRPSLNGSAVAILGLLAACASTQGSKPGDGDGGAHTGSGSGTSSGSGSTSGSASGSGGSGAGSSSGDSAGSGSSSGNASGSGSSSGLGSGSASGSSSGAGSGSPSGSSGRSSGQSSGTSAIYDCNWGPPAFTKLAPSTSPPGGLALTNVPQFVAFGFDDDRYEDGMQWALDTIKAKQNPAGRGDHCTFDGTAARVSFFITSKVGLTSAALKALHARAYQDGNEVANHTDTHADTLQANPDINVWLQEMAACNGYLTGLGVPKNAIIGFRTPFLQYTSATFNAIAQESFLYDCSVEHFLSPTGEDWPYTLDNGRSTNSYLRNDDTGKHAGMWELPVHEFMPPTGWVGVTGLDWNIWCARKMTTTDALNLLKASLDIRFKGDMRGPANRAPLFVGGHTDLYSQNNPDAALCSNTYLERRQVIEQFIDYALAYDPSVRIVPYGQIMRWMQSPRGLDGTLGR